MRVVIVFSLLIWMAFLPENVGAGAWFTLAPLNDPRQEVAVAELGGEIYVIGGIRGDGSTADTVEVYDPATDQWQFVAPLPKPLHHTSAAATKDTLFVIGGLSGFLFVPANTVFAYDPKENVWSSKTPMPTARGALAVGVIDSKIYAVGGSPAARERDLAVYDPATDSWTVLPPMPTPRNHLAAGAIRTKFYAVGGRSGGISGITNVLEEFDPATNTWTMKAGMPTARAGIAGVVVDGCLYVFGGEGNPENPAGVFEQNEIYDPRTAGWQSLEPMPTPRHGIGAAAIGKRIYIPGGADMQGFGVTAVHEAFQTDQSCNFTISPTSGTYVTTQGFDLTLIVQAPGLTVVGGSATLDGSDVTDPLAACVIPGTLLPDGQSFRCPGLTGGLFGPGPHTLSVTLDLSDGSSVTDTVIWEVLENTEP